MEQTMKYKDLLEKINQPFQNGKAKLQKLQEKQKEVSDNILWF